ncbi:UNVERIFIED_CONTAM: hypothetical protein FKN15_053386 [Acipenser sinensis]
MNTRCPPKHMPSAARFFTRCELTVQPPQSYSVRGQRSSGQLTGKPAGARPDYRGRWCACSASPRSTSAAGPPSRGPVQREVEEKESPPIMFGRQRADRQDLGSGFEPASNPCGTAERALSFTVAASSVPNRSVCTPADID